MRRDAALYEPASARTGQRGGPPTQGARLPIPTALAAETNNRRWHKVTVQVRGAGMQRLVCVRDVLWCAITKTDLLRLVIVRDLGGIEPDDFFVTTDRTATALRLT